MSTEETKLVSADEAQALRDTAIRDVCDECSATATGVCLACHLPYCNRHRTHATGSRVSDAACDGAIGPTADTLAATVIELWARLDRRDAEYQELARRMDARGFELRAAHAEEHTARRELNEMRRRRRLILAHLRTAGEATGAELTRATGIARGVIYVTLAGLEERGLIQHRAEVIIVGDEIEQWTRVYRLTDAGKAAANV